MILIWKQILHGQLAFVLDAPWQGGGQEGIWLHSVILNIVIYCGILWYMIIYYSI